MPYEKVVIVTKKTALEELIERFNTRDQAKFYLEHMGVSFAEYEAAHAAYYAALAAVKEALPPGVRTQWIDRTFVPNFTFGDEDFIITIGPDGLVVNTAKYLNAQPLFAVNPDPARIDGVLIAFDAAEAAAPLRLALRGEFRRKHVSMARVTLNDGQTLHAVNDLFVGQRTHQSARYQLALGRKTEAQSSSGIIVSTGAGSTGWFRSVLTGASGIVESFVPGDETHGVRDRYAFDWEADYLAYSVREPFVSRSSAAEMVFGRIESRQSLRVTSQMPANGVIFSDGIEEDYLEFNSGSIANIGLADRHVNLIVP
ncbi:MAG: sugar kinase [Janthinobacterium lividum]